MIDEKFLKYYDCLAVRKICAYMIKICANRIWRIDLCINNLIIEIVNQTWRNPSLIVFINI